MKWWHKLKGHMIQRQFMPGYPWGPEIKCNCGKWWKK